MTLPRSSWFTGVRVERLSLALRSIRANTSGAPLAYTKRVLRRKCGGPSDEIVKIVNLLEKLNLVRIDKDSIRRVSAGSAIATALNRGDYIPLGFALMRAGCFHDQARALIESGTVEADGRFKCRLKLARTIAPQLVGLLTWWPEVQQHPFLFLSQEMVNELSSVWALRSPAEELPSWVTQRRRVGIRAESYSVQMERSKVSNPTLIAWVSKDSDTLGWDIENRSNNPYRLIEVKGSRNDAIVFYLTENEWKKANELKPQYVVHFWGEIDLNRDEPIEYSSLRAAGYPIVIENIAEKIAQGSWKATPSQWKVQPMENQETTTEPSIRQGA